MFDWCHQADPQAKLYTNEYDILDGRQLPLYRALVERLLAAGVPVGGIGIQAHIRGPITPAQIKASLRQPCRTGAAAQDHRVFGDCAYGRARSPDPARPLPHRLCTSGSHRHLYVGLLGGRNLAARLSASILENFAPEPAAKAYRDLVYGDWWTEATGQSNAAGELDDTCFLGALSGDCGRHRRSSFRSRLDANPVIVVTLPNS